MSSIGLTSQGEARVFSNTASFTTPLVDGQPMTDWQWTFAARSTRKTNRARKEATATDVRQYARQFAEAKKMSMTAGANTMFSTLLTFARSHIATILLDVGFVRSKEIRMAVFRSARHDGYCEASRTNSSTNSRQIHPQPPAQAFALRVSLPRPVAGLFATSTSKLRSSKGKSMILHAMSFASFHPSLACHHT